MDLQCEKALDRVERSSLDFGFILHQLYARLARYKVITWRLVVGVG